MSKEGADNTQIRKRNRISRELPPVGTKLTGKSRGKVYEAVIDLVEARLSKAGSV